MANNIHPMAVLGAGVTLGDRNEIGPGCLLEAGAVLGSGNRLWMNVYIGPGTTIGDENQIHMGAVIGHLPQDLAFTGGQTFTRIGNRNVIREYVTIHRGTKNGTATVLGDDNVLMASAHLAHNCTVGSRVIMVNLATLGGYCTLENEVLLSGMVVLHQFTRVGRLAMVSGLSAVNKDVPPFMLCGGRPAVIQGLNAIGMRRSGLSPEVRTEIKRAYRLLYREALNVPHALEAIRRECRSPEAAALAAFVQASHRGICAGLRSGAGQAEDADSLLPKKRT